MPSFDAYAAASLTPGGVQSGMNDLVAALVNGPIERRRIEQQQAQIKAQNDFRNQSFAEQVAARMSGDRQHTDTLSETKRHNQAEEKIQADAGTEKANSPTAVAAREKAAEAAALAEMGPGFTARGKKLKQRSTYIPGYPTDANESGIEARPGPYEEVPWDANDSAKFAPLLEKHRQRLNASGGVQDITDQLGAPSASPNPGAGVPQPGFSHPTPSTRPRTIMDLAPDGQPIAAGPTSQPVLQRASLPPTAAAPGAGMKTIKRSALQAKKDAKFGAPTPLTPEDEAAYTAAGFQIVE